MSYIKKSSSSPFERYLLSGGPNSGKTYCLPTFLTSDDQSLVVISCPGERGTKSLPDDTEQITSYILQIDGEENDVKWSRQALGEFNGLLKDVISSKPTVLCLDGANALHKHIMNDITNGAYLNGDDFKPTLYGPAARAFDKVISYVHHSSVDIIVVTCWEDYESKEDNVVKPVDWSKGSQGDPSPKYLWPSLPGRLSKEIVGHFDARLSCRLERRCLHQCEETKKAREHHVWQFLNKGDVRGVGIKGIKRYNQKMLDCPFIHQNYATLKQLIQACV